jgi:hypothetical protein
MSTESDRGDAQATRGPAMRVGAGRPNPDCGEVVARCDRRAGDGRGV